MPSFRQFNWKRFVKTSSIAPFVWFTTGTYNTILLKPLVEDGLNILSPGALAFLVGWMWWTTWLPVLAWYTWYQWISDPHYGS